MRKLAMAALSFSAAIFAANYILPESLLLPLALCIVPVAAALALFRRKNTKAAAVLLAFMALGLIYFHFNSQNTVLKAEKYAGKTIKIDAEVLDYPVVYEDYARLNVRIISKYLPDFKAVLYDNEKQLLDARPGDFVSLRAKINTADTLFGEEYDNYHSRGIYFKLSSRGDAVLKRSFDIFCLPKHVSHWLSGRIELIFPEDTQVFMRSLMLGDKSDFYSDRDLYTSLSKAGLMHIVAVSGMHISYLVAMLQNLLGRGKRSAVLCIVLLWMFALVTGAGPSVVRAAFMHSYFLMAPVLKRENDSLTSLAAILALILCINPYAAASLSLQLSFAAMGGIVLFSDRIFCGISGRFPVVEEKRFLRYVVLSVSTSLSVMLFTVPLTALHFGSVQLLSPLTNLISLWAVSICFCWGWISCAMSLVPAAGMLSAALCSWLARYICFAAKLVSSVPFCVLYMRSMGAWLWLIIVYALFMLAGIFRLAKFSVYASLTALAAVMAAAVICGNALYYRKYDTFTILDVGQGQCVSILTEDAAVVIDCGNINSLDDAGETAAAHLYSAGRKTIDLLVLSHLHEDHADGAAMLMEMVDVRTLVLPGGYDDKNQLYEEIKDCAIENGTELVYIYKDRTINLGELQIQLIRSGYGNEENERCLITRVENNGFELLAMADASKKMERELLCEYDLETVDALIVSHHGSGYSSCDELLEAVGADTAIISVGYNYYGHPAQETLEALETYGYNVYRTDINGDIEFKTGNNYGQKSWENRRKIELSRRDPRS